METKPFVMANLAIETKAAGSLGGLIFGLGTYLMKTYVMYQGKRETLPKYVHEGVCSESMTAKTADGVTLSGHLFWPETVEDRKTLPTVIFFHGNKGTIGQKLDYIESYVKVCNCNLVVFGYRGFSKSAGHPSADGLMKDAEAILSKVFNSLGEKVNLENVVVHGRSLGGAACSYIVSREPWRGKIRATILDTTFNSIDTVVSHHMKSLTPVVSHIFANEKWEVVDDAKNFREDMPVLIIGVVDDGICPYQHSVNLHETLERIGRPATLLTFPDGGHIDYCLKYQVRYFEELRTFLSSL